MLMRTSTCIVAGMRVPAGCYTVAVEAGMDAALAVCLSAIVDEVLAHTIMACIVKAYIVIAYIHLAN